jgi:hypothetical protein
VNGTTFSFVSAERANHAVATLCRVAGASVSGSYAWLRAIPAVQSRAEAEAELRGRIGRIFAARRQVYASPRVHAGRHICRLCRPPGRAAAFAPARRAEMGLSARRGRRRTPRTTDSRHDLPVAPNLLARRLPRVSGSCHNDGGPRLSRCCCGGDYQQDGHGRKGYAGSCPRAWCRRPSS